MRLTVLRRHGPLDVVLTSLSQYIHILYIYIFYTYTQHKNNLTVLRRHLPLDMVLAAVFGLQQGGVQVSHLYFVQTFKIQNPKFKGKREEKTRCGQLRCKGRRGRLFYSWN